MTRHGGHNQNHDCEGAAGSQPFAPIEALGDDRSKLLRNIEDGMTESEYVSQFTLWSVRKRQADVSRIARATAPPSQESMASLSPEEQVEVLAKQCAAQAKELKQVYADLAQALRRVDEQQTTIERIDRDLNRHKKAIAKQQPKTA